MQTSSLNISLLKFEYKRTFECECGKTIRDFELIFWLNLVHRIRIGSALADFVYGRQILIYIREIWKKAILDPFLTKGAISRKETTVNQNSHRYSYFMGLINNIYSARCVHFKQFCTLTYVSLFLKIGYLAITCLGFALVGRPLQ